MHYFRPKTVEEVSALISEFKKKRSPFLIAAGGTDITPTFKVQSRHPSSTSAWISLNSISGLRGISVVNNTILQIGALTTLSKFASSPLVLKHFPILSETARKIASPQIQNRATVGGNLLVDNRCIFFNQSSLNHTTHSHCFKSEGEVCHLVKNSTRESTPLCRARFVSDLAPLLLILNAKLTLLGDAGRREMSLREFYLPDGITRNHLKPGEILTHIEISLPQTPQAVKLHYEKLRIRNAIDFPSLGVAVGMLSGSVCIALTGVNTHPLFFELNPRDFTNKSELVQTAILKATQSTEVLKQEFFPPSYKRKMIDLFIRRGLCKIGL